MATELKRATSTGKIIDGPLYLKSFILTPAAAVSVASLQDTSGGGGTDKIKLQAAANGSSPIWMCGDHDGVYFGTALYLTLSGASADVTVEYEK